MSNSTLLRADRATHLKIVVVSLIAAMLVVSVGVAARLPGTAGLSRIEDNGIVVRRSVQPASLTSSWSSRETATIR